MKCSGTLGADVCFFHCLHTVCPVSAPPQICEQKKTERGCRPVLLYEFTNRFRADSQKNVFFARSAICEKVGSPNRPENLAVQKNINRKSWCPIFWGFYFRPLNSNFLSSFFLGTQYVYPICLFFGFSNTECAFHVSRTREG